MGFISFRGLYLNEKKNTVGTDLVQVRPTDFYNVPLKVKNVTESEPVVKVGDEVKQGTLIAKPVGKFGINIFSPVSGKVLNIFNKVTEEGDSCKHILIMNDEKNECEDLPEIPTVNDISLIARLREAGIMDNISLIPSYLKYGYVGARSYNTLIVMMDSSDPNNTINQTLAEYRTEEVINGARYFKNITNATHVTFVFTESNYKLAMKLKKHILETKKNYDFKIKFIPNKYPFDNPYIVAKIVCKKNINKKTSFLQAGITIESAESCYDFCRAVEFNKPVITKIVTIGGDNVTRKGNYIVPIGNSYSNVLEFVGTENNDSDLQIISGGLLSGKAQYSKEISVTHTTNAINLKSVEIFANKKEYPCISCGKCAAVCPVFLNPQRIDQTYLNENYDELKDLNIHACIECGCCSYVCPAKRFLTQRIVVAKDRDKRNRGAK